MDTRTAARLQEISEAYGYAAGYDYRGPPLSRDTRAHIMHTHAVQAFAARVAASPSIPPEARPEALDLIKGLYMGAFMRGRVARAALPPLDMEATRAATLPPAPIPASMEGAADEDTRPDRPVRA